MRTIYTPNEIIIKGDIAEIILYDVKGNERARCIIDVEDVEKVKGYKWHLQHGYVSTYQKSGDISIQHIILGIKPDRKRMVDHRDRNKLNNRKFNFRVCTNTENTRNRTKPKTNTSGYKGIFWRKERKRWVVRISANKKEIYIGYFKDKIEAAMAYNRAAIKHHGEFACLNRI